MIKGKQDYFEELKKLNKHEADDLIIEFIEKFNIVSLLELPEKHHGNKQGAICVLKNKLQTKAPSWKTFAKNRHIFMDASYSKCKYYSDCFKLAFEQLKWDFLVDLCSREIIELNAQNFINVQNSTHDNNVMKRFFEYNKEIVTSNPQIFSTIINADPSYAKHLTTSQQNDLKFIMPLVNNNPTIVKYFYPSHPLLDNDSIMTSATILEPSIYFNASDRLKNSVPFFNSIIQGNSEAINIFVSRAEELPLNIQSIPAVKVAIENNDRNKKQYNDEIEKPKTTSNISKELLKEIIEKTKQDHTYIGKTPYASNPKIMLLLIKLDYRTFTSAHPTIKNTHKFLTMAVKVDHRVAAYLSETIRNNEQVMLSLITSNHKTSEFIGDKLKRKKTFMKIVDEIKTQAILHESATNDESNAE